MRWPARCVCSTQSDAVHSGFVRQCLTLEGELGWPQVNWDNMIYPTTVLLAMLTDNAAFHASAQAYLQKWLCSSGGTISYTPLGRAYNRFDSSLGQTMNAALVSVIYGKAIQPPTVAPKPFEVSLTSLLAQRMLENTVILRDVPVGLMLRIPVHASGVAAEWQHSLMFLRCKKARREDHMYTGNSQRQAVIIPYIEGGSLTHGGVPCARRWCATTTARARRSTSAGRASKCATCWATTASAT